MKNYENLHKNQFGWIRLNTRKQMFNISINNLSLL